MSNGKGAASVFIRYWYVSLTIFLGSFLLFQVQPILGKYILPWFGGTSAVWTTCLMVYQLLLLGGYLYAHKLSGLDVRQQARRHLAVLGLSLALFAWLWMQWETPITPGPDWQPADNALPALKIVQILLLGVGLPFLILSSTSSLLQKWFSLLRPGESPYGFYMISNIGSLLALLSYPFLVEPFLHVRTQALLWSAAYVAFALLCAAVARLMLKPLPALAAADRPAAGPAVPAPDGATHLAWLALSFVPCVLLLATSNHLTQNVSPIPLLWTWPLAVYLLSFVICFSPRRAPSHDGYVPLVIAWLFLSWVALHDSRKVDILGQLVIFSGTLFSCCMLFNTELYRLKPAPAHLTRFYLVLATGGALGGLFAALAAPFLFKDFYELHMALISCAAMAVVILLQRRQPWMRRAWFPLSVAAVAAVALLCGHALRNQKSTIHRARNFYGALSIRRTRTDLGNIRHTLVHGYIIHGSQYLSGAFHDKPLSYYSENSGLGLAMQALPDRPRRIGVIGLGAGMTCVFAREGDVLKFYEINPDIIRIARDPRYFTYLENCPATVDLAIGDARLALERELRDGRPQRFDVLVLDAFNSDSIPTHLLTREAFELYLAHLAPGGVIAVHVSNVYLDLTPVVWAQKTRFNLDGAIVRTRSNAAKGIDTSDWILLTRDVEFLNQPALAAVRLQPIPGREVKGWTDDYSSILMAMVSDRRRVERPPRKAKAPEVQMGDR